jgi:hypothetical protein
MSSTMTKTLTAAKADYESYTLPNGTIGWDNGDDAALRMRGTPNETLGEWVDEIRGLPKGTSLAKYDHLNDGHQRMNLGNILRAAWRKNNSEKA